jgi:hypothetical protein
MQPSQRTCAQELLLSQRCGNAQPSRSALRMPLTFLHSLEPLYTAALALSLSRSFIHLIRADHVQLPTPSWRRVASPTGGHEMSAGVPSPPE